METVTLIPIEVPVAHPPSLPRRTGFISKVVSYFIMMQLVFLIVYVIKFVTKNFFTAECDLAARYGPKSWVLITGCGSGQGRRFAIEFAKRRFNLILAGRESTKTTEAYIKQKYPAVQVKTIITNFSNAHQPDYFRAFEDVLDNLPGELSILVNNVGNRVAWKPYHTMPPHLIQESIVCGTIVQSRLTQIAIQRFLRRQSAFKSLVVNVTANCMYSNLWFGEQSYISLPYLSVYESANAFGFYHSNSIEKEYKGLVDVLNVTPGAVVTENTSMLTQTPFAIDSKQFVANVFKLMGNYTGPQFAHWGHELSAVLCNLMPRGMRDAILHDTAEKITGSFMANYDNQSAETTTLSQ
jgi:short-subunit dehydrogenase